MKNFANQISDLDKLTAALAVTSVLFGSGLSFSNEQPFGEAFVKEGVLKGGNNNSIFAAARGIRRVFELAGLLESDRSSLTQLGKDILAAGDKNLRNAFWRQAMMQLGIPGDDGAVSHPYRLVRRLVADKPGIETKKLLLALEARDDSVSEYARVLSLAELNFEELIQKLTISEAQAANAIKIFPSIAAQLGDIVRDNTQSFPAVWTTTTEDSLIAESDAPYQETPDNLIAVKPEDISPVPNFSPTLPSVSDLTSAIETRKQRTAAHHSAVGRLAKKLNEAGYALYRYPFDCLAYKDGLGGLLLEMKTLDGTRADERGQSEKALGQLRGYRFFNVPKKHKQPILIEAVAYTAKPSKDTIGFLNDSRVCGIWAVNDHWEAADLNGNISNFSPDDFFKI